MSGDLSPKPPSEEAAQPEIQESIDFLENANSLRTLFDAFDISLGNAHGDRPIIGRIIVANFTELVSELIEAQSESVELTYGGTLDPEDEMHTELKERVIARRAHAVLVLNGLNNMGNHLANVCENSYRWPFGVWRYEIQWLRNLEHAEHFRDYGSLSKRGIQEIGGMELVAKLRDLVLAEFLDQDESSE